MGSSIGWRAEWTDRRVDLGRHVRRQRRVLDVVPPATLVLMRYVIALPVLWIAARMSHTRGIQRADWPSWP